MKKTTRALWALAAIGFMSLTANAQVNTIKYKKSRQVTETAVTNSHDFKAQRKVSAAKNIADEPGLTTPAPSITVRIQPDDFPDEIFWEVYDSSLNLIAEGGGYSSDPEEVGVITEVIPVTAGVCYTFVIYDSYGDGICCGEGGDGYYQLLNYQNEPFATGGQYDENESVEFCVTEEIAAVKENSFANIKLYPNPAATVVNLEIPTGTPLPDSYTLYNSLGQMVSTGAVSGYKQQINIANVAGGVYFLKVDGGNATKTIRFIKG